MILKKSIKSLEKSITLYYSRVCARENLHIRYLFINFAPIFGILQTRNIRTILIKRTFILINGTKDIDCLIIR
jgi:hypothetical protein